MSKRTDAIRSMFTQAPVAPPEAPERKGLSADNLPPEPARRPAGAVGSIRATFSEIERENERLRAEAATAERVVEVDPALIDPSPFPDRFDEGEDDAFQALKASLAERGQEVPVLLRPHPQEAGRYQTAYGHRRVRALRALGRPVRAVVRALGDDELAAAQGVENAARADLSFIERAMFALRLEEAGRPRSVVRQALAIDKAEASKLVAVARAIPGGLAAAIGRAPRAGRPRWQALAEALARPEALARAEALTATAGFQALPSDARFAAALAAAQRSPEATAIGRPVRTAIRAETGEAIAMVTDEAGASRIVIDRTRHAGFADFVTRELPALFERFNRSEAGPRRSR